MDQTLKEGLEYFEAALSKAVKNHSLLKKHLNDPELSQELREKVQALFVKTERLIVETATLIEQMESKVPGPKSL